MRFVRDLLVVRLQHRPTESAVEGLNQDFADIIAAGHIQIMEATPEEREDNQVPGLPRIGFEFNKRDYGRLRQLLDVLNSL
jgi:hypothetical protein